MHNPDFAYYFSDDDEIDDYVRTHGDEEIYRFFCALPLGVMKADLWRYLIIAEEGGVYTDIDSFCCKPIHRWLIDAPSDAKDLLLLGLEDSMHFFCQWTIVATAHHPAMEYVCNYLVQSWREKGIDLRDPHFVHGTTGPGIWTEALLDYIGEPQATPQQIFEYYQREPAFRERLHGLGIWILPATHYSGLWSRHLFASQSFGEGYVRWPEERERLHKAQAGS
jgi:mannosyltransferase OCH1-like enzyme